MAHPYGLALHQMVTESANNGADDDQQQKQQQQQQQHQRPNQLLHQNYLHSTHQIDVRMKRHPELQPYVPSDRDRCLVGNRGPPNAGAGSAGSGGGGASSISGRLGLNNSKPLSKFKVNTLTTDTNDAKSSSMKSKKCVSMTRLDQLAQPKKRIFTKHEMQTTSIVPSSSLTSSNTTSTTNSSLKSSRNSHQSVKQMHIDKSRASSPRKEVHAPKENKVDVKVGTIAVASQKEKSENKTNPVSLQLSQEQKIKEQVQKSQPQVQKQPQPEQLPDDEPRKVSFRRKQSEEKEQQLPESKIEKTPQPSPQVNPIQSTPDVKIVNSNFETPDTPTNKITNSTFDTGRKAFQLTSINQASLWDELNGDTTNNKSLEPIVPIKQISEVSVINDQMSDLSLNDRHYQSAASDLVQDSETSSNGVNFSKDLENLCQDLGAGLIAEKMTQKLGQPETGKADKQLIETISVFSPADKELLKTLKEDEEKRIRAEEELKELAKREEQERQSRASIVDSILSRVQNQSS